jgi:hypothetical protein
MNAFKLTVAAAALTTGIGLAVPASAMPIQKLDIGITAPEVDQVRLVCNRWGRCWRTGGWGYRGYGWVAGVIAGKNLRRTAAPDSGPLFLINGEEPTVPRAEQKGDPSRMHQAEFRQFELISVGPDHCPLTAVESWEHRFQPWCHK